MNLGAPEILFLALLGVLLFGPEKLPELARKAARVVNYLRGVANDARGQIASELGPEFANIKVTDLNPRGLVRHIVETTELGAVGAELSSEGRAVAALLPTFTDADGTPSRPTPFDSEAT